MKKFCKCLTLVALTLGASNACADPLTELKIVLTRFNGREAISARVDIQRITQTAEDKNGKSRKSQSVVLIDDGPQGLKLGWTQQQLQLARKEARVRQIDRDAVTPNLDALTALSAKDAARLLDFADELDEQLSGAQLLEDRADNWQGKPARLLKVKLASRLGPDEQKIMKSFEQTFQLWLDAEGVPLGIERNQAFKASKFLISFEGGEKETLTLGRVGNRLVVLNSRKETNGAGLGYATTASATLALKFQ